MNLTYTITDDSGLLFLLNPDTYRSFVDKEWEFQQLFNHLKMEIKNGNMIGWGTGAEGIHLVHIYHGLSDIKGFRDFTSMIRVTTGRLCLLNYEEITMVASGYSELLAPHMSKYVFPVENGLYLVRVVQLEDPDEFFSHEHETGFRFKIELQRVEEDVDNVEEIPWFEY